MAESREVTLRDLLPRHWLTHGCRSVWVSAFAAAPERDIDLPRGYRGIDLDPVQAIVMRTSLSYQAATYEHRGGNQYEITVEPRLTPEGYHVLLLTPYVTTGASGDEAAARRAISTAAGLIGAINGFRLVMNRLYDNIVDLHSDQVTAFSEPFLNPGAFTPPRVHGKAFSELAAAHKALGSLAVSDANRVRLALHWYELSFRDMGRDQLIKLWVALEALAMRNTGVRRVNELLASAYNTSPRAAAVRFGVGKIQGLRSRILHHGEVLSVHASLVDYLEDVFVDVFLEVLGLSPSHRAGETLKDPSFHLDRLVHITP